MWMGRSPVAVVCFVTIVASVPAGGCRVLPGPRRSVSEQLEEGISRLRRRYSDCEHYLAYFQPATNTYAPVDRLRSPLRGALAHPQVIGLAIGTRPDCVADPVLDLLTEIAERTFLSVEYGMQTIHARSLDWMNRGTITMPWWMPSRAAGTAALRSVPTSFSVCLANRDRTCWKRLAKWPA